MRENTMSAETPQGLFEKGNHLFRERELEGAAGCYRRALQLDPEFAEACFNLGCTLDLLAGAAEALPMFERAAALRPDWSQARGSLGFALARVGRMSRAAQELEAAVVLAPADAALRNDLGLALSSLGRGAEARARFEEAMRLDPAYPEPRSNLAILFERFGHSAEAIACCREALRLRPEFPEAHHNLASALKSQGRHAEAIAHFREALRLKPGYEEARSSLLFTLLYQAGVPEEEIFDEHASFGATLAVSPERHDNVADPERILSVGYLSADFREHAVARFIEPVLAHHDRDRFRVVCYSNVSVPDARSDRIAGLADCFTNIAGMPDEAVEALIRRDGIDILVDLSGHTAGNRLTLLARKPAPLQVTWLGYPFSTGLTAVDYRITDAVCDPPGETERFHSEELLRLPGGFSCFLPPEEAPEVSPLPSRETGVVTFGSFNNPAKITPETVELWSGVLRSVPGSRMLVKGYSLACPGSRERLLAHFARHGIGAERLELCGNTASYREHLSLYAHIDIALDTFPYNGTTTTCEAIWMGVPVITLSGNVHRSRVGRSLLFSVGFPELAAESAAEYVERAAALALDPERLERLRGCLRSAAASSLLTDAAGFTRGLEDAFRGIWRRWCVRGDAVAAPEPEAEGTPLLARGKLDQALKCFLAALRRGDRSVLGRIQEALKRETAADQARALAVEPDLPSPPAAPETEPLREETLEECAELILAAGFVTPADLICRLLIDRGDRSTRVSRTLGDVALAAGNPSLAASWFARAIADGDLSRGTRIRLVKAQQSALFRPAPRAAERFLLVKAWGFGFWSDVMHVLGQLLLAELTGRTPVVHWGGNSLFSDDPASNAFENFFEPIGPKVETLASPSYSYYPPKWNAENLSTPALQQFDGAWSRTSSLHLLQREEEVVVSDFHYGVHDLVPWIPPDHPLYGMSTEQVQLHLYRRHLKVKPWIAAKAEAFYRQRMAGRNHLALHVRGGDKGGEDPGLALLNTLYHPAIERHLRQFPDAGLFLMTDDVAILSEYLERYGERVVHTGATRTDNGSGVHYQEHASRYRLGEEVLIDTLLALRCDAFIGNGLSNVSLAAAQMKWWGAGRCRLLGARLDRLRHLTLYRE